MSTVINLAKLLLLLSGGFGYFFGQGWLMMQLLFNKNLISNRGNIPLLQRIPLSITLGVIVNYAISLVLQSLSLVLTVGAVISMIGIWHFGTQYFQTHSPIEHNRSSSKWIGALFICMFFLSLILMEPPSPDDARIIWFFHAKMIYTAGSFGASAGWQHPAVSFSHVDYPNLIPGIAAQAAYLLGYWNEYITKISLVFILVPAVLWLFTFARKSFTFAILLLIFPFSINILLWNGYMDGYFALYFSIAMLLFGRYVAHNETIDLIASITCLVLLLYLKNEGLLAVIAGIISIITIVFLMRKRVWIDLRRYLFNWMTLAVGAIVLIPFIVWNIYKRTHGLASYFQVGNVQSLERFLARINDQSYKLIVEHAYKNIEGALLLLGLLYFVAVARKQPIPKMSIPALMSAAVYCIGLMAVYMLTPIELDWQLRTSANRIMLSVSGCIFVACYFILDSLECAQTTDIAET